MSAERRTLAPGAALDSALWRARNSSTTFRLAHLAPVPALAAWPFLGGTYALLIAAGTLIAAGWWLFRGRNMPEISRLRASISVRYHWAWAMRKADMEQPTRWLYRSITGRTERLPRVRSVRLRDGVLEVRAELLRGQGQLMWNRALDEVGNALERPRPRIDLDHKRRVVTLTFSGQVGAKLAPFDLPKIPDRVDLKSVPVARTASGGTYRMPVLGQHVLISGATGSGKGSVIWSIAAGLAPAIKAGTVKLYGLDGKGGVELWMGAGLFERIWSGDRIDDDTPWQAEMADALDGMVRDMQDRQARMRGTTRLMTPTVEEPLVVILVDEFLALTVGLADAKLKRRIEAAVTTLLSQGRAVGYSVIAAMQLAQKDAVGSGVRDLFPRRIVLRVTDAEQVDMVLGRGMRAKGAEADLIDDRGQEGVGYVLEDGKTPVMVRFPWTSDERLAEVAAAYGRPVSKPSPSPETVFGVASEPYAPGIGDTAEIPVVAPIQAVPRSKAEAVRSAIRAAREAGVEPTAERLAAEAGCTDRYARQILAKEREAA